MKKLILVTLTLTAIVANAVEFDPIRREFGFIAGPNGRFIGNGAGLTNITGTGTSYWVTNIAAANSISNAYNVEIDGSLSVPFQTNTVLNVDTFIPLRTTYKTNAAEYTTIDLSHPFGDGATNNVFTITGLANCNVGNSNYDFATRFYTNTAGPANPKAYTLPASWIQLSGNGNPYYNTNSCVLSIWIIYSGGAASTNFLWVGH